MKLSWMRRLVLLAGVGLVLTPVRAFADPLSALNLAALTAQNVLVNPCGGSDVCFGTGNAQDAFVVTDGAKRIRFKFDGTEVVPMVDATTSLGSSTRRFKDATFSGTLTAATGSFTSLSGGFTFLNVDHGTITVNTQPTIDATVTWNSGATTFTGFKFNATDTASAAASLLADWQVGGTSQYTLGKGGATTQLGAGTVTRAGIGTTSTDGIVLENTTDAAAGAQQYSPRLRFRGEGWKTDATAASQTVDFRVQLEPVQGAAAPTGTLVWAASINGGAYSSAATLTTGGLLTLTDGVNSTGTLFLRNAGTAYWNLPASGNINPQLDANVDVGTAAVRVRTIHATQQYLGVGTLATQGGVLSNTKITRSITGIADNTATTTLTVTVPNAAHSASLRVRLLGALGAGGAVGAREASGTIAYDFAITRTAGLDTVVTASSAYGSATSSVTGGATITITAAPSAISGAAGATQTFTINVTIARGSGASANHTCFVEAEILNAVASGITVG